MLNSPWQECPSNSFFRPLDGLLVLVYSTVHCTIQIVRIYRECRSPRSLLPPPPKWLQEATRMYPVATSGFSLRPARGSSACVPYSSCCSREGHQVWDKHGANKRHSLTPAPVGQPLKQRGPSLVQVPPFYILAQAPGTEQPGQEEAAAFSPPPRRPSKWVQGKPTTASPETGSR